MEPIQDLQSFLTTLLQPSMPVVILGLLVVFLVPLFLHLFLSRQGTYTSLPSLLLLGPSGAGKTSLLTLLERGTAGETRPSQTSATIECEVTEDGTSHFRDDLDASNSTVKKFLVVDTPGHGKLRGVATQLLAATPKLRGLVFVVDAGALSEHDALAEAATYLYEVLLFLQKRITAAKGKTDGLAIPVLIAANKADLFTALPGALVKSSLEMELGRMRLTRSKGLKASGVGADDVDNTEEGDDWLGEFGSEKFTFAQMQEFEVDVEIMTGNVLGDGPGADRWWRWIAEKI
jgi:signal recognition particle receptor subunit beta